MKIPAEKSIEEAQKSVEAAYRKMATLPKQKEASQSFSPPSELKLVQHEFTDKLICVKDATMLKLIHRSQFTDEMAIDHLTSFNAPPMTLESRVTLQILSKLVPAFFKFLNWQSMLKEHGDQAHFLGIIRKVFDDMQKRCHFVESTAGGFVQFSVKLLDMKHFLNFASQHLKLAIRKQSRDL